MHLSKNKKGFSFIEIIIAIFIFSLMMISVAGIFSNSFGGYRSARVIQKDLEDAQFIMNQMAKILRTSSISNPGSLPASSIIVFDYSQNKCFKYQRTSDKKISIGSVDPPLVETPPSSARIEFEKDTAAWCKDKSFSLEPMAAFHIENTAPFYVISSSDGELGKVTISLSICQNASSCSKDQINIQSSVSLRDYYKAGI